MQLKKWFVSLLAVCVSTAAFAFPLPDGDDPVTGLLEQYQAESQQLKKQFDAYLLPPMKSMAGLLLQMQENNQEEPTPQQEKAWNEYNDQLTASFGKLVAQAMEGVDPEEVNTQYQQMMKNMGVENPVVLTKETLEDMFTGMYLFGALNHFAETKKLTQEEIQILSLIFFPEEEEE